MPMPAPVKGKKDAPDVPLFVSLAIVSVAELWLTLLNR